MLKLCCLLCQGLENLSVEVTGDEGACSVEASKDTTKFLNIDSTDDILSMDLRGLVPMRQGNFNYQAWTWLMSSTTGILE
jgi:hypothetical protein